MNALKPNDLEQLRSFIGSLSHYSEIPARYDEANPICQPHYQTKRQVRLRVRHGDQCVGNYR